MSNKKEYDNLIKEIEKIIYLPELSFIEELPLEDILLNNLKLSNLSKNELSKLSALDQNNIVSYEKLFNTVDINYSKNDKSLNMSVSEHSSILSLSYEDKTIQFSNGSFNFYRGEHSFAQKIINLLDDIYVFYIGTNLYRHKAIHQFIIHEIIPTTIKIEVFDNEINVYYQIEEESYFKTFKTEDEALTYIVDDISTPLKLLYDR